MLDILRKSAKNIVGIGLIALLVVAFAVWGIADVFTGFSNRTIARVGAATIDRDEFQFRYRRQTSAINRELGIALTQDQARSFGIDRQVLDLMINIAAITEGAREMNLEVGNDIIAHNITQNPNFRGINGTFDQTRFTEILRQNGLTEKMLVRDMYNEHIQTQLLDAVVNNGYIPMPLQARLFSYYLEQRRADYIIVSPDLGGTIAPPSDSILMSYYETVREQYTLPERRDARVLVLEPEDFVEGIAIEEDLLREGYEARQAQYVVPERRKVDQLIISDDAARAKVVSLLAQDTAFVDIVGALGRTLDDTDLGDLSRDAFLSPLLAEAAFSVAAGEMTSIVDGPLGTVLLRVREITLQSVTPFEEVRDALSFDLAYDMAIDVVLDIQSQLIEASDSGVLLVDIATRLDLKLQSVARIDASGNGSDGAISPLVERYRELLSPLFALNAGAEENGEFTDGTYYWILVDAITPSRTPSFAEVHEALGDDWLTKMRRERLVAQAQDLVVQGNSGVSFAKLAKVAKTDVRSGELLARNAKDDVFSVEAVRSLFAALLDTYIAAPVGFGESMLIMRVAEITVPSFGEPRGMPVREGERRKLRTDYVEYFIRSLRSVYGVRIDEDNFAQAINSIQ